VRAAVLAGQAQSFMRRRLVLEHGSFYPGTGLMVKPVELEALARRAEQMTATALAEALKAAPA